MYAASILNVIRQSVRLWDFEGTKPLMTHIEWTNLVFLQLSGIWFSSVNLQMNYSNKRGAFIFQ